DPEHASTTGVGQALLAAAEMSPDRVVVGLGGSATNDAGAGMLGALGATAEVPLDRGPAGLSDITGIDLAPARRRLEGIELVVASDVQSPLLGMFGATKTYGPQKGLDETSIPRVDGVLDRFVRVTCGETPAKRKVAD